MEFYEIGQRGPRVHASQRAHQVALNRYRFQSSIGTKTIITEHKIVLQKICWYFFGDFS